MIFENEIFEQNMDLKVQKELQSCHFDIENDENDLVFSSMFFFNTFLLSILVEVPLFVSCYNFSTKLIARSFEVHYE